MKYVPLDVDLPLLSFFRLCNIRSPFQCYRLQCLWWLFPNAAYAPIIALYIAIYNECSTWSLIAICSEVTADLPTIAISNVLLFIYLFFIPFGILDIHIWKVRFPRYFSTYLTVLISYLYQMHLVAELVAHYEIPIWFLLYKDIFDHLIILVSSLERTRKIIFLKGRWDVVKSTYNIRKMSIRDSP